MIPDMSAFLVIAALIIMVTMHELGHFLAARWVGIRATKFYLFFPPAIWKRKVGEVEYGVGSIPLGGFVRLPGMFRPVVEDVYYRLQPQMDRIHQATGDADLQLELAAASRAIAEAHDPDELHDELLAFSSLLDRALLVEVSPVGPMEGADSAAFRTAVRRLQVRVIDAADDAHPAAYWRADLWRRMTVIAAGPLVNFVLAVVVFMLGWMFYAPVERMSHLEIKSVTAKSAAAQAGIHDGDQVLEWGGETIRNKSGRHISDRIDSTRGKPVVLRVKAPGEAARDVRLQPTDIDGKKLIGVTLDGRSRIEHERRSVVEAWSLTWADVRGVTSGTFDALSRILDPEVRKQFSSVAGIVIQAEDVDHAGQMVRYLAMISLALALFNILPLLPLDGGHLLFGLIEWMRRGKPVPRAVFERFAMVGLALVLLLFAIGLRNDIAGLGA